MKIIRGKIPHAKKFTVYGPEGIGKSTFASRFPEPVFIDTEGSTKEMNVSRFEKPTSWMMILEQIRYIHDNPETCKTLVIDTVDWAEQMCIEHICAKHHKDGLESFGYGSGYIYVREEFGRFLNRLEEVIEYGVNVVLIAHAQLRKFEQPDEMGAYDRWELKLGKKTASQISPLVKEWSDALLFVNYKTYSIAVDDKGKKHKAQGGKRVMYTSHHPCWDAKNRYNLPEECDFDYSVIAPILKEIFSKTQNTTPKQPVQEKKEQQSLLPDFMSIPEDADEEVNFHPEAEKKDQVPEAFKLPKSIPVALRDMMEVNLVSEEEIQTVVAQKGYFPKDTPIQNYPEEFINGVLVGAWKQVYQCIEALRASYDVPFN